MFLEEVKLISNYAKSKAAKFEPKTQRAKFSKTNSEIAMLD